MNKNMIQNKKTEVSTGLSLNDKDYMNSLLSTLKEMTKNYAVALTEASNETLYEEIKKLFDKTIALQRQTYEIMFQNGWYSIEKADDPKIKNKFNMLYTEFNDLNSEE